MPVTMMTPAVRLDPQIAHPAAASAGQFSTVSNMNIRPETWTARAAHRPG
jgi:hypothetical protein